MLSPAPTARLTADVAGPPLQRPLLLNAQAMPWIDAILLWFQARVLHSTRAYLLRTEALIGRCLQPRMDARQRERALIRSLRAVESVERHLARQYWGRRCDAGTLREHAEALSRIRVRLSSQTHAQCLAQTLKAVSNLCPTRRQAKDLEKLCRRLPLPTTAGPPSPPPMPSPGPPGVQPRG